MKATIIMSPIGVLSFSENGKLIGKILFEKNPEHIAKNLESNTSGEAVQELLSLVKRMKNKGYTSFTFESKSIARAVEKKLKLKADVTNSSSIRESLKNLETRALETGFVSNAEEFSKLTREISIELSKLRVKKAGEKRDQMVAQAILSIDDLDRTINLFMNRIREWYGFHFPELSRIVEKHETYAKLVLSLGSRRDFTEANLETTDLPTTKITQISGAAQKSMGADFADNDIATIQHLCKQCIQLSLLRQSLEGYSNSVVEEVAPNIQALVGSLLASRLITSAGGLMNLAKMPASTIQVLGAEKALFRALKTGAKPPKHGVIFQDALIHASKKWQRGKMSRALAGKLAIAARADAFSKRYIGEFLKAALLKRADEIRTKYRKPPKPSPLEKKKLKTNRRKGKKRRDRKRRRT